MTPSYPFEEEGEHLGIDDLGREWKRFGLKEYVCTKNLPWHESMLVPVVHPDAALRNGCYECPNCGHRWRGSVAGADGDVVTPSTPPTAGKCGGNE